jgi:hypothetical protein
MLCVTEVPKANLRGAIGLCSQFRNNMLPSLIVNNLEIVNSGSTITGI